VFNKVCGGIYMLGGVETGKCIVAYNFSHFAIFLPKFIKIGGNYLNTKYLQKQNAPFSETRCTIMTHYKR